MARKRKRRIWLYILGIFVLAIIAFVIYYRIVVDINPPTERDPGSMGFERIQFHPGLYRCDESWLRLNNYGLWELYIKGDPLELGVTNGILSRELIEAQEVAFVDQIKVMIPSETYLNFLKYFTAWFNKDLDSYIKQEYLLEIYGVSAFASDSFSFIGDKYDRILNYHAAHDMGHALQNMSLVKCTAFGVWDEKSSDSSLLIGRNFDFYVGDKFSEIKIIAFVEPDNGYKFASITWGGMIGVVSGMNEKGLTVTLNSAKSDIPLEARTPVSIIAREILQYASNIEESLAIARSRKSFVSESFLIGSAEDHKVVVIEKSTDTTLLYDPDNNTIILTNHFQSDHFMNDPLNVENMENQTSVYRHERVQELLNNKEALDYHDAAEILRDRNGNGEENIGMGNEKAINQLIAHHSIIFKPEEKRFWISTSPWQMGAYLCYDLDSVFDNTIDRKDDSDIFINEQQIPPDSSFLAGGEWESFLQYKLLLNIFRKHISEGVRITNEDSVIQEFIALNSAYYMVYSTLGQYFEEHGDIDLAVKYYNLALTKEVSSLEEKQKIIQKLEECIDE